MTDVIQSFKMITPTKSTAILQQRQCKPKGTSLIQLTFDTEFTPMACNNVSADIFQLNRSEEDDMSY